MKIDNEPCYLQAHFYFRDPTADLMGSQDGWGNPVGLNQILWVSRDGHVAQSRP